MLKSRSMLFLSIAAILLGIGAVTAFGQLVSGNLTGTVYDISGATIPNATVIAHNEATGVDNTAISTSTGEYRIANLPAGTYTIVVTAPGFSKAELKSVRVDLNVTATANVTLQVGKSAEVVEVSSGAVAIDTTTAQLQNTFETQQLMELPTASSGSGVINLSLLAPGVATSGAVGVGTGPSVGGQRPRNNNFTIEGVDNNSGSVTGPLVFVPNDAVAEFTFLQNQFSADFGHSSGGQFNQVVKSGTNAFHGSAFDYLENRNLNAADNINAVEGIPLHPRFDDNRFGGTFGGPIKKNKLFFFVDYEYNPIGTIGASGTVCAPTSAGYSTLGGLSGINQTNLSQLQKYLGTAGAASSPSACGDSAYPVVGPGNESVNGPSPTGVSIPIGLVPVTSPAYTNNEFGVAAIDYNISEKDSLRGRFILNRTGTIDSSGFPSVFYQTIPTNEYLVTLSEFHTFTSALVNEFRLGYNRSSSATPVPNISFPGLDAFPNIDIFELGGVNNTFGPDPNAPQSGIQNQYQLSDNISWTKGAHTLKFGFDGWKQISPQTFTQRSRGDYEWSYLSDYLYDNIPDYLAERTLGGSKYYGDRILTGYYANDSWKIKPNFTLNLGLRYEYQTVPYTERLQTENAIANVPGVLTFGQPQPQGNAFMPRVGIAYSPGTSGKTSIRAGFGMYYDVLYDNQGLLTLPPEANHTIDEGGNAGSGFLANGGIPASANAGALTPAQAIAETSGYVPNQTRPETISWNIGIQHEFGSNYTFETRYVGDHSVHLSVQERLDEQPVVNASNALPTYLTAPSQATLNGLTSNLSSLETAYDNGGYLKPAYLNAGFQSFITAYMPWGNSIYHGWSNSLTRRFSNGLQMNAAYTWSHAIDDSTADVFSTYITPRRPEDSTNLALDRSNSALDHRQRFTYEVLYDLPFFKHGNWLMKNVVGNWEFAPIYTYQSGTWYDVQSGVDSNLNADSAGDRTIVNPSGTANTGSGVTPLMNSSGQTVAYLATNPSARYIEAAPGTLPNGGRNTSQLPPINDVDMTVAKSFNITESKKVQFSARFINLFNHPQYIGGFLSDVAPIGQTSQASHNFLEPQSGIFAQPSQAFSSNPRSLQLALKFIF
ncbi:MAG: carboxypeptidase regulatory-like domain-containing protein [Bryobacteraceae bacterium]